MKKIAVAVISGLLFSAFAVNHASAETTKERWVAKKKADADREAEDRAARNAGGNQGSSRAAQNEAEEWRKNKHKEIDDTASRLGDGKKH
jgi:hypothetical protein